VRQGKVIFCNSRTGSCSRGQPVGRTATAGFAPSHPWQNARRMGHPGPGGQRGSGCPQLPLVILRSAEVIFCNPRTESCSPEASDGFRTATAGQGNARRRPFSRSDSATWPEPGSSSARHARIPKPIRCLARQSQVCPSLGMEMNARSAPAGGNCAYNLSQS
jgi:hypothetical protein